MASMLAANCLMIHPETLALIYIDLRFCISYALKSKIGFIRAFSLSFSCLVLLETRLMRLRIVPKTKIMKQKTQKHFVELRTTSTPQSPDYMLALYVSKTTDMLHLYVSYLKFLLRIFNFML